jgi:hypothetical protein
MFLTVIGHMPLGTALSSGISGILGSEGTEKSM